MAAAVALNDQTGVESEDDSMEENSKSGEKIGEPQKQHVKRFIIFILFFKAMLMQYQ